MGVHSGATCTFNLVSSDNKTDTALGNAFLEAVDCACTQLQNSNQNALSSGLLEQIRALLVKVGDILIASNDDCLVEGLGTFVVDIANEIIDLLQCLLNGVSSSYHSVCPASDDGVVNIAVASVLQTTSTGSDCTCPPTPTKCNICVRLKGIFNLTVAANKGENACFNSLSSSATDAYNSGCSVRYAAIPFYLHSNIKFPFFSRVPLSCRDSVPKRMNTTPAAKRSIQTQ